MLGYIILFFALLLIDSRKINKDKKLLFIYLFIVVFTGLRFRIGFDYNMYYDSIQNEWYSFEIIPAFFQWIAHYTDFSIFFILSSIFIYTFYFLGIKNASRDKMGSVFFFIGFPYLYFSSLSTIRQSMALAVIFYLLTLKNCSRKQAIILFTIAFLSHRSTLICLLLLYPWRKLANANLLIIFGCSFLIGTGLIALLSLIQTDNIIFLQFMKYLENAEDFSGGGKTSILVYFLTILVLLLSKRLIKFDPMMKRYISMMVLGASLYAVFSINPHVAERFCIFFWGTSMLIIPIVVRIFKIPRLIYYTLCILLFSFSIYTGNISSKSATGESAYIPYRTILFK